MTILLPYRTAHGPGLLGAFPVGPGTYELCRARAPVPGHCFGALELTERARSREISFDLVRSRIGGLVQYPALTRLPAPSYRTARRSRVSNQRQVKPPAPPQEKTMTTDAIVLLEDDHKEILRTFRDFESAGEGALKTKGRLVDRMIEPLTVHTYIENEVMYPRALARARARGRRARAL